MRWRQGEMHRGPRRSAMRERLLYFWLRRFVEFSKGANIRIAEHRDAISGRHGNNAIRNHLNSRALQSGDKGVYVGDFEPDIIHADIRDLVRLHRAVAVLVLDKLKAHPRAGIVGERKHRVDDAHHVAVRADGGIEEIAGDPIAHGWYLRAQKRAVIALGFVEIDDDDADVVEARRIGWAAGAPVHGGHSRTRANDFDVHAVRISDVRNGALGLAGRGDQFSAPSF